ncbi:MAG: alpha/beta hydrolase [Candidatus Saccharibacteria bacterium]|nr:alpha/beta hydrolase [Candidatus Saccharibacteria bacterium]
MKNAVVVPGRPDKEEYYDPNIPANSDNHWYAWLAKQLQIKDVHAVVAEPPFPFRPRYDEWKKEFERYDITPETILVGHSCGGGFLVRWLSENKDKKVGKVVLVAPWFNPDNNPVSDTADFFEFEIDPNFTTRTTGVTIFNSDDDEPSIQESVKIIRNAVPGVKYQEFHNRGHFCLENMGSSAFPELLRECLTNEEAV